MNSAVFAPAATCNSRATRCTCTTASCSMPSTCTAGATTPTCLTVGKPRARRNSGAARARCTDSKDTSAAKGRSASCSTWSVLVCWARAGVVREEARWTGLGSALASCRADMRASSEHRCMPTPGGVGLPMTSPKGCSLCTMLLVACCMPSTASCRTCAVSVARSKRRSSSVMASRNASTTCKYTSSSPSGSCAVFMEHRSAPFSDSGALPRLGVAGVEVGALSLGDRVAALPSVRGPPGDAAGLPGDEPMLWCTASDRLGVVTLLSGSRLPPTARACARAFLADDTAALTTSSCASATLASSSMEACTVPMLVNLDTMSATSAAPVAKRTFEKVEKTSSARSATCCRSLVRALTLAAFSRRT